MNSEDDDLGTPTLASFAEVRMRRHRSEPRLIGKLGAVLGFSQSGDGTEYYAVSLDEELHTCMVELGDLEPTGRIRSRSDYYSGESIRVSPDGELLD